MTAPDTPFSWAHPPEPTPEAQAASDAISEAVKRHLEARNDAIERALRVATRLRCGVRVKDYQDGRTTVGVDTTVPAWTIYQEYPDRPHYGVRFEED